MIIDRQTAPAVLHGVGTTDLTHSQVQRYKTRVVPRTDVIPRLALREAMGRSHERNGGESRHKARRQSVTKRTVPPPVSVLVPQWFATTLPLVGPQRSTRSATRPETDR